MKYVRKQTLAGISWELNAAADQIIHFVGTPFILSGGYTLNHKEYKDLSFCKPGHGRISQEYWLGFKKGELVIERNNQVWKVNSPLQMIEFKEQLLWELDITDEEFLIRLAIKTYGEQIKKKPQTYQIKMGQIANRDRSIY